MCSFFIMASGFAGCNKFLEVKPKGILLPERVEDFEAMFNSPEMAMSFAAELLYCVDDYHEDFDAVIKTAQANAYYWRKGLDENTNDNPAVWGDLYKSIYHANVIINKVFNAVDGTQAKKEALRAEALVVRADNYLTLLTIFAKAYDPATAANDPGLPLVTETDLTEKTPPRSSVQATLDTMLHNIQEALPHLPSSMSDNRYRVTRQAACGLLSRIYLYMQRYDEAAANAVLALEAPHTILDYNDYEAAGDFPDTDQKPDILWQRASWNYSIPSGLMLSADIRSYFNEDDLRFTLFTWLSNNERTYNGPTGYTNFGITFQEMELTRAEVMARKNNVTGAMDIINEFRKKRIKAAAWQPLLAATPEEALQVVLAERRRELFFGGLRWMDMKRLDREGRMPAIKRINKETGETLATLAPHSPQYTFEVPARVLQFNPGMIKNHP